MQIIEFIVKMQKKVGHGVRSGGIQSGGGGGSGWKCTKF